MVTLSIRGQEYEVDDEKKVLIDNLTNELRQAIKDADTPVVNYAPKLDFGSCNPYKAITDRYIDKMVEVAIG